MTNSFCRFTATAFIVLLATLQANSQDRLSGGVFAYPRFGITIDAPMFEILPPRDIQYIMTFKKCYGDKDKL